MTNNKWKVCAQSSNGMWLWLCDSPTQGERMVPGAESYASEFQSRIMAVRKADSMRDKWRGLAHWQAVKGL